MHSKFVQNAVALLAALAAVDAKPLVSKNLNKRDIIFALPENAEDVAKKFQPVLDFDTDSCYNAAAIDKDGKVNPGLQEDYTGITENCREEDRLDNSNVYSRARCNNGWCAIMYEYYFEKDVVANNVPNDAGHRHDWENVIVWVQNDQVRKVSPSCHDKYDGSTLEPPLLDGTHPKIVYHKDGASTHCFRIANGDDEAIENVKGVWWRSPLVGWLGFPTRELREKMLNNWSGGVGPKLDDAEFASKLADAQDDVAEGFDPNIDAPV